MIHTETKGMSSCYVFFRYIELSSHIFIYLYIHVIWKILESQELNTPKTHFYTYAPMLGCPEIKKKKTNTCEKHNFPTYNERQIADLFAIFRYIYFSLISMLNILIRPNRRDAVNGFACQVMMRSEWHNFLHLACCVCMTAIANEVVGREQVMWFYTNHPLQY